MGGGHFLAISVALAYRCFAIVSGEWNRNLREWIGHRKGRPYMGAPLSLEHISSVVCLLGELAIFSESINAKRHVLLQSLSELLSGQMWIWAQGLAPERWNLQFPYGGRRLANARSENPGPAMDLRAFASPEHLLQARYHSSPAAAGHATSPRTRCRSKLLCVRMLSKAASAQFARRFHRVGFSRR